MNSKLRAGLFPCIPVKYQIASQTADEEKTEQRNGMTIVSKISIPTIRYFPSPEKIATGTAVIIFPGGGYWSKFNQS